MPSYTCHCCHYTTDRKSSYDDHLTSKRHKKNMETYAPQVIMPVSPVSIVIPQENPMEVKETFDLDTYLNVTCKDAMDFDYFVEEYLLHPAHQDWIIYVQKGDQEIPLLRTLDYTVYPKPNQMLISFFCKTFNSLEHFQKPIFCSNIREHKFHIKQNGKWSEINRLELGNKIYGIVMKAISVAFYEATKLSPKHFEAVYKRNKNQWEFSNKDELHVIIYGPDRDTFKTLLTTELSKLCNRKQVKYTIPPANDWSEFKDEKEIIDDSDSD